MPLTQRWIVLPSCRRTGARHARRPRPRAAPVVAAGYGTRADRAVSTAAAAAAASAAAARRPEHGTNAGAVRGARVASGASGASEHRPGVAGRPAGGGRRWGTPGGRGAAVEGPLEAVLGAGGGAGWRGSATDGCAIGGWAVARWLLGRVPGGCALASAIGIVGCFATDRCLGGSTVRWRTAWSRHHFATA
jgi:hypothetical protein